jgi:hypothetical protein
VTKDGPLFNLDCIDVAPFNNIKISSNLPTTFILLTPNSQHFNNVNDIMKASSLAAWTRIGSVINPVPAPILPPGPVLSPFGQTEVTALIQGLHSSTAKLQLSPKPSNCLRQRISPPGML